MNKTVLMSIIAFSSIGLSGCSSIMSIGDTDYSCPGLPSGTVCQSVTENYDMTNGDLKSVRNQIRPTYDVEYDGNVQNDTDAPSEKRVGSNHREVAQIVPVHKETMVADSSPFGLEIINNPYVTKSSPKIEIPKVHSVWFAPRVGSDGRFYGEHNVYFVKGMTRWKDSQNYVPQLTGTTLSKPKVFKPLQVVKAKRTATKGGTSVTPNMQMPSGSNIFNK